MTRLIGVNTLVFNEEIQAGQKEQYEYFNALKEMGAAFVEVAEAGDYRINVYNAAGQLVANKAQQLAAGAKVQLTLGQVGNYVLSVEKDGQVVRTVKLLNK